MGASQVYKQFFFFLISFLGELACVTFLDFIEEKYGKMN